MTGQKCSSQELPQFSQGNTVLDAPPSILGGFLLRDSYVSSIHLNRSILKKGAFISLENPDGQAVICSKLT
jgi:hypothetical protein